MDNNISIPKLASGGKLDNSFRLFPGETGVENVQPKRSGISVTIKTDGIGELKALADKLCKQLDEINKTVEQINTHKINVTVC